MESVEGECRRCCTDVMISTDPIDTFFLIVVIALYLFLQLISRFQVSGQRGGATP